MSIRFNSMRGLLIAIASALVAPLGARAQTVFTGANDGDWNTGANWSLGTPTSALDALVNNAASNVNVNLNANQTGNANTLTINAGDSVTINNNSALNLAGNLVATGVLRFNAVGNESFLNFSNPGATISGLIDFNYQTGAASAGVIQGPGSGTLTNTGSIRGSGSLRNIRFTNAAGGLLENYQTGAQLYLDANNGGGGLFVNQGTIRALAGSTVTFAGDSGGDFNSTGGAIQSNGAGAIVRFINSASVTGGIYSTSGGGEIVVEAGHTAFASPQSLSGILRVRNNANLNINGNLTNNGSIRLTTGGNVSLLSLNGPLTLSGTGTIVGEYSGAGAGPRIDAFSHLLTLGANQTVSGTVYFNNSRVVNNGLIDANTAAGTIIDSNNSAGDLFVNNGTMRASGGGLLTIVGDSGGNVLSTGGNIQANGTGSIVRFVNSASVTGGAYSTSGGGEIVVEAGHAGYASPQSLSGLLRVRNNATLFLNGTMTNSGSIRLTTGGNASVLNVNAPLTLSGTGSIVGEYSGAGAGPRIDAFTHLLTLGANQTVSGTVHFNNSRVENNGLIDANTAAGIVVDPNNQAPGLFVNNGTMRSSGGGLMAIAGDSGGDLINNGTISSIGANSITETYNSIVISGGTFSSSGGGTLRVRPGHASTLNAPTIAAGSTFEVANNSRLYLNGTVTLPGTLAVVSGANHSYLNPASDITLTGSGVTRLTSNPGVSSAVLETGGVVTIAAGHTVAGNGWFNNTRVINNGLILADQPTGSMYLDPFNGAGTQFVNNATIRAAAGSTVTLAGENGGAFTGAGVYRADGANSFINLINGINVVGGTVTTTAGGVVQVAPGYTATLTDTVVSTGSQFTVANNADLNLNGTPVLNGALAVNAGANNAYLTINGTTNLNVGSLILDSNPAVSRAWVRGAGVLNIGANFTLTGDGYINNVDVNNAGTIRADKVGRDMYIDPNNSAADQFVNTGTIAAATGAIVNLAGDNGGNFTGAGVYRADGAGALVQLVNGIAVNGGTFTSTAGGAVNVPTNHVGTITGSTISAGSTLSVLNNAQLNVNGTITNSGTLAVVAGASSAYLTPQSDVTFAGTGTLRLTSNAGVSNAIVQAGGVVTIGANQVVAGNGYFNNARVINNGVIVGDQPTASMYLDPSNQAGTQFINNGVIRASAGATVNLAGDNGGTFSGSGAYVAEGVLQTINNLGGSVDSPVTGSGTFRATNSSNLGFRHFRVGAIEANNSGVVRINAGGGNNGTSKTATVAINTSGRVDLTDHGLIVTAMTPADVRALIAPARSNGFWNGSGIGSSLATNNGKAIGYAQASEIFGAPGLFLGQSFALSDVLVRYTFNGDTDLNGLVNFDDLLRLAQNYDTVGTGTWRNGDSTYDGNINFDDLLALAQQYGNTLVLSEGELTALGETGGAAFSQEWAMAVSLVPEPTSLIGLVGAALALRRRR